MWSRYPERWPSAGATCVARRGVTADAAAAWSQFRASHAPFSAPVLLPRMRTHRGQRSRFGPPEQENNNYSLSKIA